MQWLGAVLTVLVAAAGGLWYLQRAPEEPPPVTIARVGSAREAMVTVHVSGAVARPGLVRVEEGARVADAVVAAGGALPEADLGAVNLAARVADGQRLAVPASSAAGGSAPREPDRGTVAVNSASASELESLPGVGPVLAERIVEHRERHGAFAVVEDLLDVPGIGEAKLAALRDAVQVP